MLTRRLLLGAAGASPLIWTRAFPALAQTPRDVAVMAMVIDDIVSLDLQKAFEFSGTEIVANCYDRLVLPAQADPTKIEGVLAESWETAADGTSTFRIRQGRRFASGNPVTAEDAAFTLHRAVVMNKAPAFIIGQLGLTKENVAERITAPDPNTLVVRVASPGSPSCKASPPPRPSTSTGSPPGSPDARSHRPKPHVLPHSPPRSCGL